MVKRKIAKITIFKLIQLLFRTFYGSPDLYFVKLLFVFDNEILKNTIRNREKQLIHVLLT